MLTTQQAIQQMQNRGGRFFFVRFRLKNAARDGRPAGTVREMRARLRVRRYYNANTGLGFYSIPEAVRDAEDQANDVLTCWDVERFHDLRSAGVNLLDAGRMSYRRINLRAVLDIQPWVP